MDQPPLAPSAYIGSVSSHHRLSEQAHTVQEHLEESGLQPALRLRDLVMTQILVILVYNFVGTAAKLDTAHVWFWIPAVVLFYIPLGMVVSYLNSLMPLEGGIYQWAKIGLNDFMGFFVAWNTWLYVITYIASVGVEMSTYLAYILGPEATWVSSNKVFITILSCAVVLIAVVLSIMQLERGKIIYNLGSAFSIAVFALLMMLPLLAYGAGAPLTYPAPTLAVPAISAMSLNILMKMAFGALSGFEYVAVFAGESQQPARNIALSVLISAPIILALYVFGTSSVLTFTSAQDVDLIAPVSQTLTKGFGVIAAGVQERFPALPLSIGILLHLVAPTAILLLALSQISYSALMLAASARLPMVAGWDNMLPAWFSRIHPTYKTPVNSILFIGTITLVIGLVSIIDVGEQEAFQLMLSNSFIFYAISYLVMFALPLLGARQLEVRIPISIKAAALSGGLMSLGFIILSLFPIVEVESVGLFAIKVSAFIIVANLVGVAIYHRSVRRIHAHPHSSNSAQVS
jgi:amino acid transporter